MDYAVSPFGDVWQNGIFNIPVDLVDKYFNFATEKQIKALLFILRHGGKADTKAVSSALGVDEKQADEILEFWVLEGVIACNNQLPAQPEKAEKVKVVKQAPDAPKLSPRDIVEFTRQDPQNAMLLNEAEQIKGRSLSNDEKSAVINMVNFYGLCPEVILMLIHFYFSERKRGKTIGNAYLLKMAANWANDGIATIADAEIKLAEIEKSARYKNEIKAITGLTAKTQKQEDMILQWFKDFDTTMITIAFETMKKDIENEDMSVTIPTLAYMNSILKRWKKYNISNPKQLEDYLEDLAQKLEGRGKSSSKLKRKPTYDIEEIKKKAMENTDI